MMTREEWLTHAADNLMADLLAPLSLLASYRISVGFPKGRHGRGRAVGQCWPPSRARDGKAHIFISPERDGTEAVAILATVLHELIHASDGCVSGHRGAFAKACKAVGLQKPYTSSSPDATLTARLNALSVKLGPFPHAALVPINETRPGSRLRLWMCHCPVKIRVASDHLDVTCNDCGEQFERAQ